MVSAMPVIIDESGDGSTEVNFTENNQTVQTLMFYGANEALGIGFAMRYSWRAQNVFTSADSRISLKASQYLVSRSIIP